MAKFSITMRDELLSSLDEAAAKAHLTRSAYISHSVQAYIESMRFSSLMDSITGAFDRLATDGNDDAETLKEIEKLMTSAKFMSESLKR